MSLKTWRLAPMLVLALLCAPAAAQAAAPSLSDTAMISEPSSPYWGGTLAVQTVECNTLTGTGRVRFQATGRVDDDGSGTTAYAGTYSEEGEFVISATPTFPGSSLRTLTSFDSTFTVTTNDGRTVSGSRSIIPGGFTQGHCGPFTGSSSSSSYSRYTLGFAQTRYTAEIRDAADTLVRRDAGTAESELQDNVRLNGTPENFTARARHHASQDADGDGLVAAADNCPTVENRDQANFDGDAQGDACDADDDNDGVSDASDAFPRNASESVDTDHDGTGDNADLDDDGDNVADADDAFPIDPAESVDTDGDGTGDNADADDDDDTHADDADAFPLNAAEWADNDADGTGDNADTDDDDDTVADTDDNCATKANSDQANLDGDAEGDECDSDDDADSVIDAVDNCDRAANTDQGDNDVDGQGDVCDSDDDNDGFADEQDNCPTVASASQRDSDADGKGDACDTAFDSTDGQSTGGGWITDAAGAKVHFSYTALSKAGRVAGIGELRDGAERVRLLDADGYSQADGRSVIVGTALVGGARQRYRLETLDAGEPGRDRDTFELEIGSRRWAGALAGGNLDARR